LRKRPKRIPEYFDEYRFALLKICSKCEPEFGAMGVVGFLYQSVKDSIKEEKLKVKTFRGPAMAVGRLVYMKEEDFNRSVPAKTIADVSAEEINKLAGV